MIRTKIAQTIRKSWVLLAIFIICGAGGAYYLRPSQAAASWQLYWSDEFNGSALDTQRWKAEHSTYGDGNNELACLTPNNVTVTNGSLKIISKKESITCPNKPTDQFSSGFISSRLPGGTILYPRFGKYEIRAKLPHAQGIWPAFWLRHRDGAAKTEIDIMEYFHNQVPGKTTGTLHYNDVANVTKKTLNFETPTASPGWHTWAVEIEEVITGGNVRLRWLLDDVAYHEYVITNRVQFDKAENLFDIAINTAVGGNWVGRPDDALGYLRDLNRCSIGGTAPNNCTSTGVLRATFPTTYELDYVRVYTKSTAIPTPTPVSTPTPIVVTSPTPTPSSALLAMPTNVQLSAGDASIQLRWNPVSDNRVDQYSVRYIRADSTEKTNGSAWQYPGRIDGRTTDGYTITGLVNGVAYDVQLRSVDELGTVDGYSDYTPSQTITPLAPAISKSGDATGDGAINIFDLNIVIVNWGRTGSTPGDLNKDSRVDLLDFNIVIVNWGK